MAETVVLKTGPELIPEFLASDHEAAEPELRELHPIHAIHELSPYGLLLAGLAECTAILLHTYARNHNVPLLRVELRMTYARVFATDCQDCDQSQTYTERIGAEVGLVGDLPPAERNKLFLIARHCPVHKILHDGIQTEFVLRQD
ncbi:MAG: OsmC-like protein [Chloroflexi bacterium ADurb.Bin180]|nr:MAG: OsmC-like protein [Chloroflexi bacterium ADurb.Bin180]HNR97526.1 OsmC family protein [Anaerolineae bacterium]HNT06285.1 OsmC family protein [Anaerolineae bacterium]HOU23703.1 OsmC family protein [Anaerolineae bacterium]HQJ51767.1 OsmC family protein [Anaerolineae bacterium]